MHVIGTAGHVDHGKSTLVTALTGIDPDRLKEEQERQMTIDLGFAWLTLPDGEEVGIVDVPGHRDFIGNMLAGVGGIDAALLIVAADEGVMPQTREHLAILDLLQIPAGLVVLTKIDLVDDPSWIKLVEDDIQTNLRGTVLEKSPILRVSSRTRAGFPELLQALALSLKDIASRPDLGRPRLPVDRVFSIAGFGTVVTGTLTDGVLSQGEELEILPGGLRGRVRGLETHKKTESQAIPGARTAVNVSGINVSQIHRGDVVAHPGQYRTTQRLDVKFRLLPDASSPLRHGSEVKLYLGTTETVAGIRLLGMDLLEPGEEGWLQIEPRQPVVAVRGDRFILRRPSPGETLGGGTIVDPAPKKRYKRTDREMIDRLAALSHDSPADLLLRASQELGPAEEKDVVQRANLEPAMAIAALNELADTGRLIKLEPGGLTARSGTIVVSREAWSAFVARVDRAVRAYHQAFPLRPGVPREELKSRLGIPARIFTAALNKLVDESILVETGNHIALSDWKIQFSPEEQSTIQDILDRFKEAPYSPPSIKDCQITLGEEVYNALVEKGELLPVSAEVVFRKGDFETMVEKIKAALQASGKITLAEVRDLFDTSRRYVQALLEYLDATGVTVREGDARKLRR